MSGSTMIAGRHATAAPTARAARSLLAAFVALAGALALTMTGAFAQPKAPGKAPGPGAGNGSATLLTKVTPEQMADILTKTGYQAQVQGSGQQKSLTAQFFPGPPGKVAFAGCDNAGCSLVEFVYDFGKIATIGPDWVNAWNDQKSVSAVLQDDGSLRMLMWTHLFGPVTAEHLAATARMFVDVVNSSTDFQPGN
jgi:hypothetical protein